MKRRRILCVFSALVLLLSGCSVRRIDGEKKQDLDYKTLDRLGIPEKLWKWSIFAMERHTMPPLRRYGMKNSKSISWASKEYRDCAMTPVWGKFSSMDFTR